MLSAQKLFDVLNGFCPLELSLIQIRNGEYDNSGLLIRTHDEINKILFSLDLSVEAVKRAKKLGADTIVTHHPAIYHPVKEISSDGETAAVCMAIQNSLNVYSMHLNLDVCDKGIDSRLSEGLGGENPRILFYVDKSCGYGREFSVKGLIFSDFIDSAKKTFGESAVTYYGNEKSKIKKVASFCGAGSGYAVKAVEEKLTNADVIVTSDVPHHIIKSLVERDKKLLILTHYSAENYGFEKFYQDIKEQIKNQAEVYYFSDKRF